MELQKDTKIDTKTDTKIDSKTDTKTDKKTQTQRDKTFNLICTYKRRKGKEGHKGYGVVDRQTKGQTHRKIEDTKNIDMQTDRNSDKHVI